MRTYIFLLTISSILALDTAHLKPGALTAHLGRVSLVEDVLWVRYPYTALSKIPSRLKEVTEHLNTALGDLLASTSLDPALLDLTHSRLLYLNVSITHALENYYGFDVSNRTKRGLIDGCPSSFLSAAFHSSHVSAVMVEVKSFPASPIVTLHHLARWSSAMFRSSQCSSKRSSQLSMVSLSGLNGRCFFMTMLSGLSEDHRLPPVLRVILPPKDQGNNVILSSFSFVMYSAVYIRCMVNGLAGTDSLPLQYRFGAALAPWVMKEERYEWSSGRVRVGGLRALLPAWLVFIDVFNRS
ncbi:hypothetical protein E2C01_047625 [Portunus trituberculatus]|uniref:Uncharacterized protein n=1 Tax=Portunus trituberculatus TaxID=210409 RepID=A0A5B7G8E3_PORTR|nr:hypothetical protein [Portunus trituberculatus]